MKRFLVALYGNKDNLWRTTILGELNKDGVYEIEALLGRTLRSNVFQYNNSDYYVIYRVIHANNRKEIINDKDEMSMLYKNDMNRYNEQHGRAKTCNVC